MPTPNLGLPQLAADQAQKHVTVNEALLDLDALVQLAVLDRSLASPPGSPSEGARYIVAASPTGAWAGHANQVAAWLDGAWRFFVPGVGWLAWVVDEAALLAWNGSAWVDALAAVSAIQNLALLGIRTTADATNRLAVKSDGVLLSHDDVTPGTGHMRVALNKSAAAKDASFTFQDGFSTRALFGLLADDDFTIKVSPDGSTFYLAVSIDKDTGHVGLGGASADATMPDRQRHRLPVRPGDGRRPLHLQQGCCRRRCRAHLPEQLFGCAQWHVSSVSNLLKRAQKLLRPNSPSFYRRA